MSEEYPRGRRDELRLTLTGILANLAKWHALLGESPVCRTNARHAIIHRGYRIALKRVQTMLDRLLLKSEYA